jgi:hypothetical protein
MWRAVSLRAPQTEHLNLSFSVSVPHGQDVDGALAAIKELVSRHEALRTRFYLDDSGAPRQIVASREEVRVEVREEGDGEPDEVARKVRKELSSVPFAVQQTASRFAIVTTHGRPTFVVLVVFHVAADGWTLRRLKDELLAILQTAPGDTPVLPRVVQVSERIAYECSTGGVDLARTSLRYWEQELQKFPAPDFLDCTYPADSPRYREILMYSRALRQATALLARRFGVGVPAIFMGLTASVLSDLSGKAESGFLVFSHNRYTRRSKDTSCTLVQNFPVAIRTDDSLPGKLCQRIQSTAAEGMFCGQYDPEAVAELLTSMATAAGHPVDTSCAINIDPDSGSDASGIQTAVGGEAAAQLRELSRSTRFADGVAVAHEDMSFYLHARHRGEESVVSLRTDTCRIPLVGITAFLQRLETLALAWVDDSQVAGHH